MRQSMSRRGNCWDNAVAESFFATLKKELVRNRVFDTPRPSPQRDQHPPWRTARACEWTSLTRWLTARRGRGLRSVATDGHRLTAHVLPRLGALPMAKVTRTELEEFVEYLDGRVRAKAKPISWKMAVHVWGLVTKMFDVDLERGVVHIHRSVDRETGDLHPTKTSVARRVSIRTHASAAVGSDAQTGEGSRPRALHRRGPIASSRGSCSAACSSRR